MTAQSNNIVDFQLHTLGWKAFQDLSVTIMTDIFGHDVQSFFDSHDGGRDGAYHGVWIDKPNKSKSGSFTAQCKFTSDYKAGIKASDLKDDIEKAKRLAAKGLAKYYVLFTNAQLTGYQDESLRAVFEGIDGIEYFAAYGKERISQLIVESPRLRMLVPRVYGLGDLSQILDERAGEQANAILNSLGDDISKFVLTDAFNRSAKALVEHSFVLLLGEPACGKSTIAASLALGALDEWGCNTFKLCSSDEFLRHWNPNEPKRLFWIDDAFGATQVDWSATFAWTRTFPHISTAIKNGAKVIFTSRDYIYQSAKGALKESSLPVMKASQVVINVQDISQHEREQILYNHIKLGNQPQSFKKEVKPFLKDIANNEKFTPEIARRLGDKFFTKDLRVSKSTLVNFVESPVEFLIDVLSTLDKQNISALAAIFMRAGALASPIELAESELNALKLLGGTLDGVITSLKFLEGSLTSLSFEEGQYVWRYKHPTIRDAFAQYVADDVELLEIYLGGAPLEMLFQEVACIDIEMDGVKVIVPESHYFFVINRMKSFEIDIWYNKRAVRHFLAKRCNHRFLSVYLKENPDFLESLKIDHSVWLDPNLEVISKLFNVGLLPEERRIVVAQSLHKLAIEEYDTQFAKDDVKILLSESELSSIQINIKEKVINNIECIIDDLSSDYDEESDPEEYFSDLDYAINDYEEIFSGDDEICTQLAVAKSWIKDEIKEMATKWAYDPNDVFEREHLSISTHNERSIFDDVDN
ncbi:hypothetical protein CWB60_07155 [Pseudoalteromonas sp. S327]|uniref:nSTAND3 domain-containing NTPase n=1 Tax=unclassified Pseudoalteromonas TaxID=194690 RepID=UPI00110BBD9D|nr:MULTISPECIES: hypothetical protein [unclassified Pseudoalteromonas]TMO07817.1 hypothetical protein CWB60_07155 [Pseudoalteromonas sp. S327]TMO15502.1 hypothetical protein CWB59_15350 [Pseudoalteromonas sp. S326]